MERAFGGVGVDYLESQRGLAREGDRNGNSVIPPP